MRFVFKISIIPFLFFSVACNTTRSNIAFSREEYRAKNESVLYVWRDRAFVGGGVETVVYFDGISVGLLPQKGYYPIHALSGGHNLRICSGNIIASEQCHEFPLDMKARDLLTITPAMHAGNDFHFESGADLGRLADLKNEGVYYDAPLRDTMPASERRVALTADALGGKPATGAKATLKVAILDFKDETGSNIYTWLGGSLPDAIDQSMRKEFEYKRQPAEVGANLVISGKYEMASGKNGIHIEAKIYYRDTDQVLGAEGVDAPLDAGLFNSTRMLSDKLVAKFHRMVRR